MGAIDSVLNAILPISKRLLVKDGDAAKQNWYNHPETEKGAQKIVTSAVKERIDQEQKEETNLEKKKVWMFPVKIRRVTSPYGWRLIQGQRRFHNGTDYTGQNRSAQAPTDGIIKKIVQPDTQYPYKFKYNNKTGQFDAVPNIPEGRAWTPYMVLQCLWDENIRFVFRHGIVPNCLEAGTKVSAGDDIYKIGNYGFSMGDHLHFELVILKNGKWIEEDPDGYIAKMIQKNLKVPTA